MSRSGFLRSVYNFATTAGVVAAGTATATIYLGKRYQEKHGHHHPFIENFHKLITPIVEEKYPLFADEKQHSRDLPHQLAINKDGSHNSTHLNGLLLYCALSGTSLSEFVISILDDKKPIDDILVAIEDNNELATSEIILYNNPESSYNLAHIAAMSNRKSEEKTRLIEFLQQKGVDIDAKGPLGETVCDICPDLFEARFKRPEVKINGLMHENLQHESLKEDPYFRSI